MNNENKKAQDSQSDIETKMDIEKLANEIKKHFDNDKNIEIKINDNSEELLNYKQLEIKAKKEQPIKIETFKKCLETANKFNDDKKDDKANKISIKFTNFEFNEDIKGKIKDDLSKKLSKIGICYENCKFKNYEFEDCVFKTTTFKENCTFVKINFRNCRFEGEFYFKNCTAKEANFSLIEFKRNTYFNNTTFENYANFHEAEFYAVACFYGAKFEKPMNFSSAIFKDFNKTDFVNLNIENINLENIKTAVEKNYKDESYKKEKSEIDKNSEENEKEKKIKELDLKYKIRWANNFRDSFRAIKHSLIETNNNLEASNLHKLELYAKEIELAYQIEKEYPNFATQKNAKVEYKKENHKFNIINWLILFVLAVAIAFLLYHEIILEAIVIPVVVLISIAIFIFICFLLFHFAYYLWLAIKFIFKFIFEFINSKTPKDAINYIIYIIQTFYNSINRYINKEYFKTLLDYTKYIDYWKIRIYRNTSEHHTNFTRILNFTIVMISLYGLFILIINKTTAQTSTEFVAINVVFTIFIMLVFVYFIYVLPLSAAVNMGLFLILMLVCVTKIFSLTILSFYGEITFFAVLYLLSVLLLYRLFIAKNNLITFTIRAVAYIGFLFMIYISPSMILPFANLNSNSQNQFLEAKIFDNINLASIINPEFNATKNPNSSENLSISELNEYKKFIVENKDDLYKKLDDNDKFKQAIYADSSRDKTIKCISFIYAIILGLCLFSLQKTARRNSVVPS